MDLNRSLIASPESIHYFLNTAGMIVRLSLSLPLLAVTTLRSLCCSLRFFRLLVATKTQRTFAYESSLF